MEETETSRCYKWNISGGNIKTKTEQQEVNGVEQLHTSLGSLCAMQSISCIGLWSSGTVFSGVMNHTSLSGRLTEESRLVGESRRTQSANREDDLTH